MFSETMLWHIVFSCVCFFLSVILFNSHRCRPIPESELGLALLFVSLDKYCNPSITAGLYKNNALTPSFVPPKQSIDNVLLPLSQIQFCSFVQHCIFCLVCDFCHCNVAEQQLDNF